MSKDMADFIEAVGPERPMMVISFGNPYLLAALPESPGYLIAWGGHEVSQEAAVRALFGREAISGRLPVSIPPYHGIGDGLTLSALPDPVDMPPSSVEVDPETVGMDADRLAEIDAPDGPSAGGLGGTGSGPCDRAARAVRTPSRLWEAGLDRVSRTR